MAGETVQIDLDEVQAAATAIAGLLDELNGPVNQLEAEVKQVQDAVYGTDLLGKALVGDSSAVGGLGAHQTQVLEGIKAFLQNAAAVAANLRTMAARHQSIDEEHVADLRRITTTGGDGGTGSGGTGGGGAGGTVPLPVTAPLSGPPSAPVPLPVTAPLSGPPSAPVPAAVPEPGSAPETAPAPGIGYHDPTAPDLDYNEPVPHPEVHPGGGGGRLNYI
ncbi:hypothetical protein [Kitasatospora sp. NPDC088783]|uniref:hypothetical protein n=1 Tax=Kitasatospora sp. NPDC088783 TaxID=3364077 RepID=UPI0038044E88